MFGRDLDRGPGTHRRNRWEYAAAAWSAPGCRHSRTDSSGPDATGARWRPDILQNLHIFLGPRIAIVLAEVVAVPPLVRIVATGDDVDGESPVAELVERCQGARRERRRHEAGAMRQQQADTLGLTGDVAADQETIGCVGIIADQNAVEPGCLMRLGKSSQIRLVDDDRRGPADASPIGGRGWIMPMNSKGIVWAYPDSPSKTVTPRRLDEPDPSIPDDRARWFPHRSCGTGRAAAAPAPLRTRIRQSCRADRRGL